MLSELRVENLGIIAELQVTLGAGLTVITGETGAGKTLIVDALDLLTGGRADPQLVREGAAEARVEGRFDDGDDEIVLARVIPADGRSRGYVNGRLATVSELAECGRRLVDLHGQHTHQSLLAPAEQRALLDTFVGPKAASALAALRTARTTVRALADELAGLGGDERARAREVDLLRYQVEEIDAAGIADAGEDDRLLAQAELLADAEAHREALSTAYRELEGGGEDALGAAVAALAGRAPFAALAERLRLLQADIQEAAHDVRTTEESIVADPERLQEVQTRRARLAELKRKYGPTLADVVSYVGETRQRLADLEQHDARAALLESSRRDALADVERAARALSKARRAASPRLADAVTLHLRDLALPAATFTIQIESAAVDASEITDDGADDVTFLLAPNPGEPARPLAKAASGGELSRSMLALRLVLSEAPPTLVFDEVDAGIGGEAGAAVGRALATLGGHHQVLCVTHLPQVAAFADAHVLVAKDEIKGRTVAGAALLLDDARVNEISRMLAGVGGSAHARRHARELVTRSGELRVAARAGNGSA
ncbi:MAG TPA: DNA repair protein RecN [Acidimicrobiia bacterium]|nr:DNA repair protein RecN [Acidimicrobiia bacterium]